MGKLSLSLPPRLHAELRALARRTGRSQAALTRDALQAYVAVQERPWPTSIGIGADGSLDATRADAWLEERWDRDPSESSVRS